MTAEPQVVIVVRRASAQCWRPPRCQLSRPST